MVLTPPTVATMTIREAARYLSISEDTLYRYASTGRIPAFKLGNRWRFTRARLDQWINDQMPPERTG